MTMSAVEGSAALWINKLQRLIEKSLYVRYLCLADIKAGLKLGPVEI